MGALEGKVALVTGSGRGLGRECARIFAREGARVVVADVQPDGAEETVKIIKDAGGDAIFVKTDVASSVDVQAMVKAAVDTYGGLDCAVNNAVRSAGRHDFAELSEEDWDQTIAVNLTGVFLCMKYQIRAMLQRGAGAIVNIASGNEHAAAPGIAYYIAAKVGIQGLARVAAIEYGAKNIRVNTVGPGSMWTPLLRETADRDPTHVNFLTSLSPLGRLAEPSEVAETAIWLCTDGASYVTGHTLLADGGAMIGSLSAYARSGGPR